MKLHRYLGQWDRAEVEAFKASAGEFENCLLVQVIKEIIMSNRQNVIRNKVKPALPAGWWNSRNRRKVLLGMVLGIIAETMPFQVHAAPDAPGKIKPATIEPIDGMEVKRVKLIEKAAQRLGIQTTPVHKAQVAQKPAAPALEGQVSRSDPRPVLVSSKEVGEAQQKMVVPYSALLYDVHGNTWVYTSPEPLTFVRQRVTVESIEGEVVTLSDGLMTGVEVVTVGAAELYGTELRVGY